MDRDSLAMIGVPVVAGLVTALVLVGPGVERPVSSVRVRGAIARGSRFVAVRVQTVTHHRGLYTASALGDLALDVTTDRDHRGRWEGSTGDNGFAEARIALTGPITTTVGLEIRHGDRVLGKVDVEPGPTLAVLPPQAPRLLESAPGIAVRVVRGFALPPFPEELEVTARPNVGAAPAGSSTDRAPAPPPRLRADALGADVRTLAEAVAFDCTAEACGQLWRVEVAPHAPAALLDFTVGDGAQAVTWRGDLPLATGGYWLDPEATSRGELHLRAGAPRDEAFVSIYGARGRLAGAIVRMDNDEQGMSSGHTSLPPFGLGSIAHPTEPVTVVASSDGDEPTDGSVAWPLFPDAGMVEAPALALLLDGMPGSIERERQRQTAARRPAYGIATAALLFELFFLWRRNRLARARLEDHVRRHGEGEPNVTAVSTSTPLLYLVLMAGGLVLAFAILAAMAAWG